MQQRQVNLQMIWEQLDLLSQSSKCDTDCAPLTQTTQDGSETEGKA